MEVVFAVLVGIFVSCGVYLILSRNLIRIMFGLSMLSSAINIALLAAGRLPRAGPPILSPEPGAPLAMIANPVPQALVLTAIVISFGLMAFVLVLTYRGFQELQTVDTDAMRMAEPKDPNEGGNVEPKRGGAQ